jgi:hypothetical protein
MDYIVIPDAFEVSLGQDVRGLPMVLQSRWNATTAYDGVFELHLINDKASALYAKAEFDVFADLLWEIRVDNDEGIGLWTQSKSRWDRERVEPALSMARSRKIAGIRDEQIVTWRLRYNSFLVPETDCDSSRGQPNGRQISPPDVIWGSLDGPPCKGNGNLHWLIVPPNRYHKAQAIAVALKYRVQEMREDIRSWKDIRKAA